MNFAKLFLHILMNFSLINLAPGVERPTLQPGGEPHSLQELTHYHSLNPFLHKTPDFQYPGGWEIRLHSFRSGEKASANQKAKCQKPTNPSSLNFQVTNN